jgi:hypothetical protein
MGSWALPSIEVKNVWTYNSSSSNSCMVYTETTLLSYYTEDMKPLNAVAQCGLVS